VDNLLVPNGDTVRVRPVREAPPPNPLLAPTDPSGPAVARPDFNPLTPLVRAVTTDLRPIPLGEVAVREVVARPASLWRRVGAMVVDVAVLAALVAALLYVASVVTGTSMPQGVVGLDAAVARMKAMRGVLLPALALSVMLALGYTALFAMILKGRTFGRLAFGLRLVDASGQAPLPLRALTRAVLSLLSFTFFLAGFWLGLVDRKGQTLHDKLAGTFVVRLA
jgi:uncharacterized RDD family membrane protein YckC